MARPNNALETADMLYRAAMEPALWPDALESFAHAIGCVGMAKISITPHDTTTDLIVSPSMRGVQAEYNKTWWQHDSRVGRIFQRQLSRGVFCEAQLFNDEEIARDPFRQEFCRDFGLGAFAVQLLEPWPGHVVSFSGQRSLKLGHFEVDDLEMLNWLGKHAARALMISLRLAAGNTLAAGLFDVLDKFHGGVFVLNNLREVVLMNACAERLIGDGVTVSGKRLLSSSQDCQQALDRLIASAFDRQGREIDFGPLALPRSNGKKPLLAQALPLRGRDRFGNLEQRLLPAEGALVLVIDPVQPPTSAVDGLRLLGLTAAEARLAALVGSGVRRREAADALGVSEWTARTALKHIYSKLDISSSGELVRLVDRVAALA